jgi:hypothetical protein
VQAIGVRSGCDIACFAEDSEHVSATTSRMRKRFAPSAFIVGKSYQHWDLLDANGNFLRPMVAEDWQERESAEGTDSTPPTPDEDDVRDRVRQAVKDTSAALMVWAHQAPSCPTKRASNYRVALQKILKTARREDLSHLYLVSESQEGLQLEALAGRVDLVTQGLQDCFLDVYRSIRSGGLLSRAHHDIFLAFRLAAQRPHYVADMLQEAAGHAGEEELAKHELLSAWWLASVNVRREMVLELLRHLGRHFREADDGRDYLPPNALRRHADKILATALKHL